MASASIYTWPTCMGEAKLKFLMNTGHRLTLRHGLRYSDVAYLCFGLRYVEREIKTNEVDKIYDSIAIFVHNI